MNSLPIAVACLSCTIFSAACVTSEPDGACAVSFDGEVLDGAGYSREFGGSLVFALDRANNAPPNPRGWTISIRSRDETEAEDLVWAANPPYRGSNVRDLTLSYGSSVDDIVSWTPREFKFYTNRNDNKRAVNWVRSQLWPANAQVGPPPPALGRGRLEIVEYATSDSDGGRYVSRLAFSVELRRAHENCRQRTSDQ